MNYVLHSLVIFFCLFIKYLINVSTRGAVCYLIHCVAECNIIYNFELQTILLLSCYCYYVDLATDDISVADTALSFYFIL